MALKAFALGAVQADATLFGGITRMRVATGTEVHSEATTGELYPRFQAVTAQKPGASFSTYAIAQALAFAGLLGTKISDLTNGLILYLAQKADEAGRLGDGSHTKYVFRKGLVLFRDLTCAHQGNALLSAEVIATWDGENDPIVPVHNVNLPSWLVDTERYTLGPVTIANVVHESHINFELTSGLNAVRKGAGSSIWDPMSCIDDVHPVLTLRGLDPTIFASSGAIPLEGKKAIHTETSLYLRRRAESGGFVPDGTAEHVKFTAAGLAYIDTPAEASGSDDSETTLTMPLKFDGTNPPLVIDTAAAIT